MSDKIKNEIKIGDHTRARIELYTVDGTGIPQTMFVPVLLDDISWTSEWACTPSKMTFTVLKEGALNFGMGTKAVLKINDEIIWTGYVMYKHRTSDVKIDCTAYDQLRYLKLKMWKSFEDVQYASDPIKEILEDYELPIGEFDDLTQATQGDLVFDGKEALEVIDELMQKHAAMSLENLVFFDKAGEVCLKKLDNMRVTNQFFTAGEMEDWDYTSSIEDSYNSIMIDVLEADGETHDRFITVEDEGNINRWGLLRYVAQSNEDVEAIQTRAERLLEMVNREVRTLKLQKVLGNPEIRGGSLIAVKLNLGDMLLYSWMVVREVTHTLGQDGYTMDMTVTNESLGFGDPVSPEGTFTVTKPTATESASGSSGGTAGSGGTGTYEERMWNMLRAEGFSAEATAGVLANAWAESGVEPTKHQYDGNAYGLFQWDDRKQKLINWCQSNGKDYTSFEGQMDYMLWEFYGGDSTWVAYANANCAGVTGFKNLVSHYTATVVFLRGFERAGVERLSERTAKAKEYYDKWGSYETIPGTGGSTGDGVATGSWTWPCPGVSAEIITYADHTNNAGDIKVPAGTKVVACDGGYVDWVQPWDGRSAYQYVYIDNSTYGNCVRISHGNGYRTLYAHLSQINVTQGQAVSKGQQIGLSGNTGRSFGPHLHLEIVGPNGGIYPGNVSWS